MARRHREASGGQFYHAFNRGVRRSALFRTPRDYVNFQWLMVRAVEQVPMRIVAYVLMPNHWHLVLWPELDDAISAYIKWLAGTHACHFNAHHGYLGTVYESRFKSVPIYGDMQLLRVLRYVESNPVRARLVERAEQWEWSSVAPNSPVSLTSSPVPRPSQWLNLLADRSRDLLAAVERSERSMSL